MSLLIYPYPLHHSHTCTPLWEGWCRGCVLTYIPLPTSSQPYLYTTVGRVVQRVCPYLYTPTHFITAIPCTPLWEGRGRRCALTHKPLPTSSQPYLYTTMEGVGQRVCPYSYISTHFITAIPVHHCGRGGAEGVSSGSP